MNFQQHCVVCGNRALFPPLPSEDAVCASPECRFVVNEKRKIPPAAYAIFFARQSHFIRERIRQVKQQQAMLKQIQDKEALENHAYWLTRTAELPHYNVGKIPLIAVPQNARKLTNLPERRKRDFRDSLNKLISKVMENSDIISTDNLLPNPPPPNKRLFSNICALCRGACCLAGNNHAYISETTLARVLQAERSLRPRHILDLYLSHLDHKTIENGCVYLGETGCTLPARLRSNTCSDYFCDSLNTLNQRFFEEQEPEGAFVVVRAREHWSFPEGSDNGIAGAFLVTEASCRKLE